MNIQSDTLTQLLKEACHLHQENESGAIMLREVSQACKEKYYLILLICGSKKRNRSRESKCCLPGAGEGVENEILAKGYEVLVRKHKYILGISCTALRL